MKFDLYFLNSGKSNPIIYPMVSKELIEDFFDDQFQNTSQFFLYKDKQLLKEKKYREFAEEQIKKAKRSFWSVGGMVFFALWYGTTNLINYGNEPTIFNLVLGLGCIAGFMAALLLASREYYSIKSSMTLLLKLLDNKAE
ncbi:MAG: hypothetical protein CL666_05170 [Balneola sp.]|nr:hypothetical protein [Balneola sp.]